MALHRFLGVSIERVKDNPLGGNERVVVLVAELPKALGNGLKTRSFGLLIQRDVRRPGT